MGLTEQTERAEQTGQSASAQRLADPMNDSAGKASGIDMTAGAEWRVRGMFFSGTGTTKKVVTAVAEQLAEALTRGEAPCDAPEPAGDVRPSKIPDDVPYSAPSDTTAQAPDDTPGSLRWHRFRKAPDIDFTPPEARERVYRFDDHDIVVFGVPVIAGRVPNVLLPFLNTLEGDGAMATPIVLYGNRNFDDALIELRDILEERGFYTIAAAAFIGEHSFSRVLAAGRPDERDMDIAAQFAKEAAGKILGMQQAAERAARKIHGPHQAAERAADIAYGTPGRAETESSAGSEEASPAATDISEDAIYEEFLTILEDLEPIAVDGETPLRPYYKPRDRQGNHINILKVKPKLDPAKCTRCGICVAACPMGSIKPEAPGIVDGICIKCCGCEKKCPEGALYFDDPGYLYHKEELELGYPERREPKLFL